MLEGTWVPSALRCERMKKEELVQEELLLFRVHACKHALRALQVDRTS